MSENNYHFYGLLQITKNKEGNSVCFGNGEFAITSLALRSPFNSNSAGLYFRVKTRKKFVCIRDRRFLNAQTIMSHDMHETGVWITNTDFNFKTEHDFVESCFLYLPLLQLSQF
mmetsp:Transcript_13970/g.18277  ORF Transcript_13970/g.18277 Transcript_13970/m.18277 type:complete len:114 (-) Transcript_13970:1539-1880(-)